ncbi:uncharacterized protein LOC111377273 [Olea europaea var. sylvestris]|uniref:uncharacterized protein LOC111377273 n=1 Tax=Olea europaea var. sylvestris TaxID=158386 RepID=UPI000C1CF6C9|nr:uncharacterized protein LOC111377273 [Olea europaea var. sylvestris]
MERKFPSDTEINPKEHCKAIILRSGKEVGENIPTEETIVTHDKEEEQPNATLENKSKKHGRITSLTLYPSLITHQSSNPHSHFHKDFKRRNCMRSFSKFLGSFKKIHINIPFADALEQMPNYAKFMKEVMSKKRKLEEYETTKSTEELVKFFKGRIQIASPFHALLETPLSIKLFLAYRSLTYPRGIIEDVLVKVDKFIFPIDFVVLDMEEDQEISLILDRPFLATGKVFIDVQGGQLTLTVNEEEMRFNIYQAMQFPNDTNTCHKIDFIDAVVKEEDVLIEDHLEHCMMMSATRDDVTASGEYTGYKVLVDYISALESLPNGNVPSKNEDIQQTMEPN